MNEGYSKQNVTKRAVEKSKRTSSIRKITCKGANQEARTRN